MGNEPPTLGSDDATMDVDSLLVEPQDGNLSMDSVMCFNEKITDNALDSGAVSRVYDQLGAANARDKEDNHKEQVLDAMPSGDRFQIHDQYCNMGDDYLLGVEFAESITNIDYGSGEGLQISVSDSQLQVPSDNYCYPWKSEIIETSECQNGQFNTGSTILNNFPNIHGCGMRAEDHRKNRPESHVSQVINYRSGEGFDSSMPDSQTQGPNDVCFNPWKLVTNEGPTCQIGQSNTGSSGANDDTTDLDCKLLYEEDCKKARASCDMVQVPDATCTSQLKSEVKEVPNSENGQVNSGSSIPIDVSNFHVCTLMENTKLASAACISQNMGMIIDKSGDSSQNTLSDQHEGTLSPSNEMVCTPEIDKTYDEMNGKFDQAKRVRRRRSSKASAQGSCDVHLMQKRLRKPTQRYIDELSHSVTSRKRREFCSSPEDEPTGVKYHKKGDTVSRATKSDGVKFRKKGDTASKATKSDEDEFSVKAIQVPFGSVVNQERPVSPVHVVLHGSASDRRTWTYRSRDDLFTPDNQMRKYGNAESSHLKRNDDRTTLLLLKSADDCVAESPVKKRSARHTTANEKKKNGWNMSVSPKKKDTHLTTAKRKKKDDSVTSMGRKAKDTNHHRTSKKVVDTQLALVTRPNKHDIITSISPGKKDNNHVSKAHNKKRDEDYLAIESPEQVSGRRKNHRLWTITEVRKLLDGVSQYGVGRWSRIKKLLFASSPHRTSVDLKDKWRNLLKASGLHDQGKNGDKKRNVPWRPLPKSVLRHVRELASMHPYPKGEGRRVKVARKNNKNNEDNADGDDDEGDDNDDDDDGTDITLSDYRKILQSTNGD